jgi:hypothetical protein
MYVFYLFLFAGFQIVGHSGASYGYRSFVVLLPHLKAGVFVVMNGDDDGYVFRGPLINLILDTLLETPSWVDTTTLCTFPSPWYNISQPKQPPFDPRQPLAHNVSSYLGVYESPSFGRIEIRLAEEVDRARQRRVRGSDGNWWNDPRNKQTPQRRFKHQTTSAQLTLLYGFARWDLLPIVPRYAAFRVSSRENFNEHFYGVGREVTAFVDYADFIFHPPPSDGDLIMKISAPAFESRLPPVFYRVVPRRNSASSNLVPPSPHHSTLLQHSLLTFLVSILASCR